MRNNRKYSALGLEIDVFPYLGGGYNGAIWYGYGPVRGRAIVSSTNTPGFFIPDGFRDNKVMSYAVMGDYFLQSTDFDRIWVGIGAEYWDASITSENFSEQADYVAYEITGGVGYILKVYRTFYINPWFGLHLHAGGDTQIPIGMEEFTPPTILPQISVKLGWSMSFRSDPKWFGKSHRRRR